VSTVLEPVVKSPSQEIAVTNPATGKVLYAIAEASDSQIQQAFKTAQEAHTRVSRMSVADRVAEMGKLQQYILKNREAIMDRICEEAGKTRMDALLSEIFTTLDVMEYYKKNAAKILADQKIPTPIVLMGKKAKIFYEPIGPVLIISPWNYPFNLTMVPFICAFLAGNSVIFKPSEFTPLKGLLEKIVEESGFVKGALNIVYGAKETGKRLIDMKPAKVFFTGSVRAGRQVMTQAAQYLIPVELELGGKDPMVVFDDVDIERTVNGALWGGMTNCGQTCTAVERILVQERIYPQFVSALTEKAKKLRNPETNPGADATEIDVGCMTPDFQIRQVEEQVADAKLKGAEILSGGARKGDSHAFPPTILTNVDDSMTICNDETFGPVVTVQKFKTEDEAIKMSNDSPYGLSASVWSTDLERAERVARKIQTGSVSINNVLSAQAHPALPFGGAKESGFGRYKGPFGLHAFCNIKSIMSEAQSNKLEFNWYPYSKEKYQIFSNLLDALYSGSPLGLIKAALLGKKLEGLSKRKRL
jgi:acyl-CoA reductase-like NAD-dependent aldehyde dehydrogenase